MRAVLPDLLRHDDGSPVSPATWEKRRQELYQGIVPHEYGGMPPAGEGTEVFRLCCQTLKSGNGVRYCSYEVRTRFSDDQALSFVLNAWVPGGDGPFPVVLNGDGCWRYFTDAVVDSINRRGYVAASFNRTCTAADDRSVYRRTGLYRVFPAAEFGALAAWAWGYHRCVDALSQLDFVRTAQIAITGHSRGGKTVLLAGATDDRIAITNPNDSGIGGSGLNRWKCPGAEVVDDFIRVGSIFWFGRGFAQYQHRDRELPYDQHFLHALVAPRGLLVSEAGDDAGANPPGSYAACQAAGAAYEALGAGERLGWVVRPGGHGHLPEDFDALLDFADWQFHGHPPGRAFRTALFPNLSELLS
jgi:hypothetical protein